MGRFLSAIALVGVVLATWYSMPLSAETEEDQPAGDIVALPAEVRPFRFQLSVKFYRIVDGELIDLGAAVAPIVDVNRPTTVSISAGDYFMAAECSVVRQNGGHIAECQLSLESEADSVNPKLSAVVGHKARFEFAGKGIVAEVHCTNQ